MRILLGLNSVGRISHGETPSDTLLTPLFTSSKYVWLKSRGFFKGAIERTETTSVGDDRKKIENHSVI